MAIETTEYLRALMPRMIRAAGRRAGDADPEDLADLMALADVLEEAIAQAVKVQREVHGRSWADLARPTRLTRQALHLRFAHA